MITGGNGLFASGLDRVIGRRHQSLPITRAQADLTVLEQVRKALAALRPDVVVHTAGIPDLDRCESNPSEAFRANVGATANVVSLAEQMKFGVVLISTDAVFDGLKHGPYEENDEPRPLSVYGRTKLEAEREVQRLQEHWIFRVSVLFGPGKDNVVTKCLRTIKRGSNYVAASDQIGSATYTLDAAEKIVELIESRRYGLYHLCNQGRCSRLELAQYAAELAGLDKNMIEGKTRQQMNRRAPRPKYAEMKMAALENAGLSPPRGWKEALAEYLREFCTDEGSEGTSKVP
ncbi:MAG TPA: NAD(P)-dependent oxidoreductase [Terriglobales bacterium]|nr:NAD(P)-dependent oxidoreductase [Terriglobales bacterium]